MKILENFRKHLENIFEQSETKRIPLKIKKFTLEVKDPLNGKRQTNKNWFQESASLRGRLKIHVLFVLEILKIESFLATLRVSEYQDLKTFNF